MAWRVERYARRVERFIEEQVTPHLEPGEAIRATDYLVTPPLRPGGVRSFLAVAGARASLCALTDRGRLFLLWGRVSGFRPVLECRDLTILAPEQILWVRRRRRLASTQLEIKTTSGESIRLRLRRKHRRSPLLTALLEGHSHPIPS